MNTLYRSAQGDTLSYIAWKKYGASSGNVEKILAINHKLAALPVILPLGTLIRLPEIQQTEVAQKETVNLWT